MKPSRSGAKIAGRPFPQARPVRRRFQGKIILARRGSGIFPESLAHGGGPLESPENGNGIPLKHEDYESDRKNQKYSRQQVGKNRRIGCHGRHRVQLALFTWHITRMDSRGHRVFQRGVQIPLPDSLYSRGIRHHPVHPKFPGFLKSGPVTILTDIQACHDNGSNRLRLPRFFIPDGNFLPAVISQTGYSSFFLAKIAFCPVMRKAAFTGWLAGKKSSSRREGTEKVLTIQNTLRII